MSEDEREFLDLFHRADTTKKIVIVAIMSSGGAEDGLDMIRASKALFSRVGVLETIDCW